MDKVQKKLQEASNTIDDVARRRRAVDRRLRGVEVLPDLAATELLELAPDAADAEEGAVPSPAFADQHPRGPTD
jgi:DNA recombination protein RmuC